MAEMASAGRSRASALMPSSARFSLISRAAARSFSTKTTCAAPRLTASIPTAPVPANRSRKRAPSTRGPRILNRVSRSMSLVGRMRSLLRGFNCRERNVPAMMRMAISSADAGQLIAALPCGGQRTKRSLQFFLPLRLFGQPERFPAPVFQKLLVAERVRYVKSHLGGLPGAEKFAGAANLQVGFGDFESVPGAHHGFQARPRLVGHAAGSHQHAVGFMNAAADSAAQLVQLREAEAFCVFDDHDRGVRNIHADFDDRGCDKNLGVVVAKRLHDRFLLFAG